MPVSERGPMSFEYCNLALMAAILLCHAAWAGDTPVRLLDRANVSSDTITLSDFLSSSATAELRDATIEVKLGRSPQPGSTRWISAAEVEKSIPRLSPLHGELLIPASLLVTRECSSQDHSGMTQRIANFLNREGWIGDTVLADGQVRWPARVCALDDWFQPANARWDMAQKTLQVTLRSLRSKPANDMLVAVLVPGQWTSQQTAGIFKGRLAPPQRAAIAKPPVVVKAGDRATLFFDQGTVHLSLPVICLQPGRPQEVIRVRAVGQRTVLRAAVISAAQLRAVTEWKEN